MAERVIDLLVNPFTPEMRSGPYGNTADMRGALTKLDVFDDTYQRISSWPRWTWRESSRR